MAPRIPPPDSKGVTQTGAAPPKEDAACPPGGSQGESAWKPRDPNRPSNPNLDLFKTKTDHSLAARLARVGHDIATVREHFNFFSYSVEQAISKDAHQIIAAALPGMPEAEAMAILEKAQKAVGHRVGWSMMSRWEGKLTTVDKVIRKAFHVGGGAAVKTARDEGLAAADKVIRKALHAAGDAAAKTAREEGLAPELATKLGHAMGHSTPVVERVTEAAELSFKLKWLGRIVPVVGAGLTFFDIKKALRVQSDPKATTLQKVGGWLTALADACTFVPIPLVSLAAGVASIPTAYLRDSAHPVDDLEKMGASLESQAKDYYDKGLSFLHLAPHLAPAR